MEKEFWIEKWNEGQIGFHQSEYNKSMRNHYDSKDLTNKNVFIPLAGKSNDIIYFLERGANVYAVEISKEAVNAFFKENEFDFSKEENQKYEVFKYRNLTYYHGDFFTLSRTEIPRIDFLYDRASVIALPPTMRKDYYSKINELIGPHTDIHIQSYTHDGPKDFGPPFYVPEDELDNAYKNMGITLKKIQSKTTKADKRFREAGLSKMTSLVWYN